MWTAAVMSPQQMFAQKVLVRVSSRSWCGFLPGPGTGFLPQNGDPSSPSSGGPATLVFDLARGWFKR